MPTRLVLAFPQHLHGHFHRADHPRARIFGMLKVTTVHLYSQAVAAPREKCGSLTSSVGLAFAGEDRKIIALLMVPVIRGYRTYPAREPLCLLGRYASIISRTRRHCFLIQWIAHLCLSLHRRVLPCLGKSKPPFSYL